MDSHRGLVSIGVLAVGLGVGLGCPTGPVYQSARTVRGPDELPPPLPEEPAPAEPEAADVEVMHEYFSMIAAAQWAAVEADEAGARQQGQALAAKLRAASPPGPWAAFVEELVADADRLGAAEGLPEVSAAVAELARGCGGCHESLKVTPALPEIGPTPAVPEEPDRKTTMRWHAWAAARLWEGLVGPSEDRWLRGTTTFHVLPGCGHDDGHADDAAAHERCAKTRALGQRAHIASTAAERVAAYGRLLANCASCHAQAKKGPPHASPTGR